MSWLLDTLVWTGALIGLVLAARRPLGRHFGPRAAYALWALPLIRLVLPPIVLPASMAPQAEPVVGASFPQTSMGVEAVAPTEPMAAGPDWLSIIAIIWLVGAFVYIGLRLRAYHQLRAELLLDARAVGSAGRVRLIETSATGSPLAFGLIDKVIALPPGFMAQPDRSARDLALAHELAHHHAHDLAANFAALALFALHWFNPLSWFGWTAMRRDQEAACDARVIEGRERTERASYAALIAHAVSSPKAALAAPMACPVLGEKSIIHRLRSLTMSDHSLRRRRVGNLLIGLGALGLPLTASISYAQSEEVDVPAPPAPPSAPLPADAPLPPEPPVAPEAPLAPEPGDLQVFVDEMAPGASKREVIVVRDGKRMPVKKLRDGKYTVHNREVIIHGPDGKFMDPDSPEFRQRMKELEVRLGKLGKDLEGRVFVDEKRIARITADAHAAASRAQLAVRLAPRVVEDCEGSEGVSEIRGDDGSRTIRVCRTRIVGETATHLRAARASVAADVDIAADTRRTVLEELDRAIARLEAKE